MKLVWLVLLLLLLGLVSSQVILDDEFDEFEAFEPDEDIEVEEPIVKEIMEEPVVEESVWDVELDDLDEDEFHVATSTPPKKESTESKKGSTTKVAEKNIPKSGEEPKKSRWNPTTTAIIVVVQYIITFYMGRGTNRGRAMAFAEEYVRKGKEMRFLFKNFYQVGVPNRSLVQMESAHRFSVYCTGRKNCESLRIQLDLLKRQAFGENTFRTIFGFLWKGEDTVTLTAHFPSSAPKFVFAVVPDRKTKRLRRKHPELNLFCRKFGDMKGYAVFSELPENDLTSVILTPKCMKTLRSELFRSMYISYVPKARMEEGDIKYTYDGEEMEMVMKLVFKLPENKKMNELTPLMRMALHFVDVVGEMRISKRNLSLLQTHYDAVDAQIAERRRKKIKEAI